MPPRRSQVAQSRHTLPRPPTDASQTRRARTRAHVANHVEGESFDLSDISGSDDDDDTHVTYNPADDSSHTNPPHNRDVARTSQTTDARVNDPSLLPPKMSTAADVHYFFEKEDDKMVCVECR
jgi:hypothetical protein